MSDKIEWESYSAPQKEGDVWIVEVNALENTGPKSARVFKSEQEAKTWIRQQVLSPLNVEMSHARRATGDVER